MYITFILAFLLMVTMLTSLYFFFRQKRMQEQFHSIQNALDDIKNGDLNHRILTRENDAAKSICYDINTIAKKSQEQYILQKKSEQAYKRLMTSLSHDVKTPLASLVGYMEAIEKGIVSGEEKEEYIHVAFEKTQQLKNIVEHLFEWVKLDAGEQIFHFEPYDINELTRECIADWIVVFEKRDICYEILIPETEYFLRLDQNAYSRILNNLFQNLITHSQASEVKLILDEQEQGVEIQIVDNGIGISVEDLPHIFERMYQCDHSRSARGNGLGLSITKELVNIHQGTIHVTSRLKEGTKFTIFLPKIL